MASTSAFVNVVVGMVPLHVSGSITGIGLTHEVNDVVIHILILVNVSVVGGVSVSELIGVVSNVVGLEFSQLNERFVDIFLVLGEVLNILPPVSWSKVEILYLRIELEERVLERFFSFNAMFLWVSDKVSTTNSVNIVLLSEVAWAFGPVNTSAVRVGLIIIVILDLNHGSISSVLLGEAVFSGCLWVSNSIWVGDPSVMIVVDGVGVIKLNWAFRPSSSIILLTVLGEPLFLWTILLGNSMLDSLFILLSNEGVDVINVVKLDWAFGPSNTVVLNAVVSEPVIFWTSLLNWWVANLS